MGNPKFSLGIRIVAGVYLIYLAWQILRDGLIRGGMTGGQRWIGIGAVALFIIAGGYLAIKASRDLTALTREERSKLAADAAAEAAEEFEEVKNLEECNDMEPDADDGAGEEAETDVNTVAEDAAESEDEPEAGSDSEDAPEVPEQDAGEMKNAP